MVDCYIGISSVLRYEGLKCNGSAVFLKFGVGQFKKHLHSLI